VSSVLDQVESKIARAKRASRQSRKMIVSAENALEGHECWLHCHRAAWVESVKHYQQQLDSRRRLWALKRLLLRLLLIGPILFVRLVGGLARALRRAREIRTISVLSRLVHAKRARIRPTNSRQGPQPRISGLDGPLCTGQPWSPEPGAITKSGRRKTSREIGLLPARLVVASIGAVIVGCLAAAATPEGPKEPPTTSTYSSGGPASLPRAASNKPYGIKQPAPHQFSGFSALVAPMTEPVPPLGMTVAEIVSITRPSTEIVERPAESSELADVTVPARKPNTALKAKLQPASTKHKRQLTLGERLPWLH
jgi:hypothetical protein